MYKSILTYIDMHFDVNHFKQHQPAFEAIGARLSPTIVEIAPPSPAYVYGVPYAAGTVYPSNWYAEVKQRGTQIEAHAQNIRQLLHNNMLEGEVDPVFCDYENLERVVARQANLSDLVLTPHSFISDDGLRDKIISHILFSSCAPIMSFAQHQPLNFAPKHIMLAWDGSTQAASAAHKALPFFISSEQVKVAIFDPDISKHGLGGEPGADIAAWLAHHGCKVEVQHYPTAGQGVGKCLLNRAKEADVDLIVMGAFGHAKFLQRLFGGTTQLMLAQKDVSVFMSH